MIPITKGQRVFTCGHSFHEWIAPIVADMASAAGIEGHQVAGRSAIAGSTTGGTPVSLHLDLPAEENRVVRALRGGAVDVLTLSPIWLPDEGIERFARLAFENNPDVRVTIQEFWLPNDTYEPVYPLQKYKQVEHNATAIDELRKQHDLYFQDMEQLVRSLNHQLGQKVLFIVPVAQAVIALREKIVAREAPGLKSQEDLFLDSWGHVREHVKTLNAYCHFAVIYRRSPVGLPVPKILTEAMLAPGDEITLNLLLQELAWDAVQSHPLSGVN